MGGQNAADDVYIRADCWKSTYKAIDTKMKETPLIIEASAGSGRQANFNHQQLHKKNNKKRRHKDLPVFLSEFRDPHERQQRSLKADEQTSW